MSTRKFTQDEIDLISRTMMQGASHDDVLLFIATCERTGLDPFTRQIMPSSRNTKKGEKWVTVWTWIVTIDGLRKIAVDSGDYEGQDGPFWCGQDGAWKEIWTDDKPCFAAKVLVHRKGFRSGLSGIAKYDSYVQKTKEGKPNQVWQNLGDHMTAKCAEALALRRAYPNEMAGLYTGDEMGQAGFAIPESPKTAETRAEAAPSNPGPYAHPWSIDELEEFELTKDRAYAAFRAAGKTVDDFNAFAETWKKNQMVDPAEMVLTKFAAIVGKLEEASKKKASE